MITPRRTRLLRVPDLRAFQRAIAASSCPADVFAARQSAVILPTAAAAAELRVTLENLLLLGGPDREVLRRDAIVLPDLVTRDEWYRRMHDRVPGAPPALSRLEREVLFQAAAREAIEAGCAPPFRLRPGLVTEIVHLYDDLHRHRRTVDAFERLLFDELEPRADADRGAGRLLRQTRFLAAAFRAYERRRSESGRLDEQVLRILLLDSTAAASYARVVVTVGDRASDPAGLFAADFDLLTRVNGLEALDVIATEESLDAGLGERLRQMLPGIDEEPWTEEGPPLARSLPVFSLSRDREEELAGVVRAVKAQCRREGAPQLDRTAVVFRRPLPYVYLAQAVFDAGGVPYQAADALPLAAEPYAASLDLIFSFVESGFARSSTTALLSCPHFSFEQDGVRIDRLSVSALDRALADAGYLGGQQELARIAASLVGPAAPAAHAAAQAADELVGLTGPQRVSDHLATLIAFLDRHDSGRTPQDEGWERHIRARSAIRGALDELREAHVAYSDPIDTPDKTAASFRRWIESQMFSPRRGSRGVRLVDAQAARYGDYDDVFLVGLVETDWPGGRSPNIFYPSSLLAPLGWPADQARLAGVRASFIDLTRLAHRAFSISAFTLEDDAQVERSSLLEGVTDVAAPATYEDAGKPPRIFVEEALVFDPVRDDAVPESTKPWIRLRQSRSPASDSRFHGSAGPFIPDVYTVSAVDLYLTCPFKFLSTYVLKIEEEPDDDEGMTPRARGEFVHGVLGDFYAEWEQGRGGAIAPSNLDQARRLFTDIAIGALAALPAGDAATERLRLLGSPVAPGVGEIVLGAEAASPAKVTGRLIEHTLEGEFTITGRQGSRSVRLRGKVDRIDLLAGSSFRIVDYKTGRATEWRRSIQLPIYAVCTGQWLSRTRGHSWKTAEAAYLVLSGKENVRPVVPDSRGSDEALAAGQQRFLDAIEGMARGEFPPRPVDTHLCASCRFSAVCRKDYVVDQ